MALNNQIIYSNNTSCNFSYITPKIKEFNYLIELGGNVKINNGTITPVNGMELNFNKLKVPFDFTHVEEEKFITSSKNGQYKMEGTFKLPKKVIIFYR